MTKSLFDRIWSRILKNEGKLMKTKRGVVFSYRITKYKKSIMPQYHLQHRLKNSGPEFPIIGESRYIGKTLIKDALDLFPTKGPMELKRLLNVQNLDTAPTHLWGILNDKRIRGKDY